MSFRHVLNERPALTLGVCLVLIAAALAILIVKGANRPVSATSPIAELAFYSDDDGQTVFVDDAKRLTPFLHDGKEAVRAYVYLCGNRRFIGYLQRHTEYGRQQTNALEMSSRPTFAPQALSEVKRPGTGEGWVPADQKNFDKVLEVMGVSCPGKGGDTPVLIFPGP